MEIQKLNSGETLEGKPTPDQIKFAEALQEIADAEKNGPKAESNTENPESEAEANTKNLELEAEIKELESFAAKLNEITENLPKGEAWRDIGQKVRRLIDAIAEAEVEAKAEAERPEFNREEIDELINGVESLEDLYALFEEGAYDFDQYLEGVVEGIPYKLRGFIEGGEKRRTLELVEDIKEYAENYVLHFGGDYINSYTELKEGTVLFEKLIPLIEKFDVENHPPASSPKIKKK